MQLRSGFALRVVNFSLAAVAKNVSKAPEAVTYRARKVRFNSP